MFWEGCVSQFIRFGVFNKSTPSHVHIHTTQPTFLLLCALRASRFRSKKQDSEFQFICAPRNIALYQASLVFTFSAHSRCFSDFLSWNVTHLKKTDAFRISFEHTTVTTKKKIHCISNKFRSHNCTCLYTTYLQVVQETVRQSVCAPGAGLNSSEVVSPCVLPLLYCLATSVVRSHYTTKIWKHN